MITLIRSECCFLFVLSPDAPQFHFRMSAAPRRQDDDDERMRVLCARRLILQWNKYNKEEEKKSLLLSGVLLDQVVIINHNAFYVLVNVILFSDRCFLERNRRLPDRKETGKVWRLFNTTTTKNMYRCLLLGRMARNGSMTNG